jgi:hypothetical protein
MSDHINDPSSGPVDDSMGSEFDNQGSVYDSQPGDDIYGKIASEQSPFEKILAKIPGFSGYMERQNRRDADKFLRTKLADRFEELWQRVSTLQREFISQGEIAYVDDLEGAAIKMRTFADRVRRATRGYSGLFDAVLIGQEELAQLYQYDAQMLEMVDDISRAIDNVEASVGSDGLPAAIRHLTKLAQQAIDVYNQRSELVFGTPQG